MEHLSNNPHLEEFNWSSVPDAPVTLQLVRIWLGLVYNMLKEAVNLYSPLCQTSLPDIIGNKILWRVVGASLQSGRDRARLNNEGNMAPVNIYNYQAEPLISHSHVPGRKSADFPPGDNTRLLS